MRHSTKLRQARRLVLIVIVLPLVFGLAVGVVAQLNPAVFLKLLQMTALARVLFAAFQLLAILQLADATHGNRVLWAIPVIAFAFYFPLLNLVVLAIAYLIAGRRKRSMEPQEVMIDTRPELA